MPAVTSYEQAVSAWTDHLRDGGTTTWSTWRDHAPAAPDVPVPRPLPDATHLELLRRLNLAAGPRGRAGGLAAGLADRVLATSSPGRGLLEVPLPWPAAPRPYGTPAIEPEQLPTEELIRLATGVLAHVLPDVPLPATPATPAPWPLPGRRRFRLHGAPMTVAGIRGSLLAQGLAESDWRPTHVVVALPVDQLMAEHWAAAVRAGGILKWTTLWRRAQASGRLPEPVDVSALCAGLRTRRREPLHVVVARDPREAAVRVGEVLRARPVDLPTATDAPLCDLLRRVNRLTALTEGPQRTGDLARALLGLLEDAPAATPAAPPGVPATSLAWARSEAAATADRLRRADYAVHGDPDFLTPADDPLSGTVDRDRTLELALTACLRAWHLEERP